MNRYHEKTNGNFCKVGSFKTNHMNFYKLLSFVVRNEWLIIVRDSLTNRDQHKADVLLFRRMQPKELILTHINGFLKSIIKFLEVRLKYSLMH